MNELSELKYEIERKENANAMRSRDMEILDCGVFNIFRSGIPQFQRM